MASLIGISERLETDDVIRKIRRLSVVLDTSVREMEKDLAPEGDEGAAARSVNLDYRNILVRLREQKALQDERRLRLSQVSQRRHKKVDVDTCTTNELEDHKEEEKEEESKRKKYSNFCSKCNIKVNLEDITTFAICRGCDQTTCRSKYCSDWDRTTGYWECLTCISNRDGQLRAGEWILDQLNRRFKTPGERIPNSGQDGAATASHRDVETQSERSYPESTYSISIEQKAKVREFLEEIISEMVGGPLDEVPVTQLHKEQEYLPVWDHECPGISHLKLKRLITKITQEAMRLPELFNHSGVPPRPEEHMPFFDPKKYEQLVATAVLNKIVESYRNPLNVYVENSSGVHTGSETENGKAESVAAIGQFRMDTEAEDSTDLNEYVLKHKVPLPDLSGLDSGESTTDDMSSTRSTGTEGTWEENWLFKKKKLKAETSASIAMLVPSPTEEVKALIGDKNADEISDLSEAEDVDQPDSTSEDEEAMGGVKELPSVLVQSKTLIGGKNELLSFDDNSSPGDSLVSNPDSGINVTDARNDVLMMGDEDFVRIEKPLIEAINESKVTPVAAPRKWSSDEAAITESTTATVVAATPVLVVSDIPEEDLLAEERPANGHEDEEQLIPGSLAEREHLKWLHATAEIPNNPYSPEALEKRLLGSTSSLGMGSFSAPAPSSIQSQPEPTSIASAGNSENERDVGEEEVLQVNGHAPEQLPNRSIQAVLGGGGGDGAGPGTANNENDYKRYGRDYYINAAKRASGSRKKSDGLLQRETSSDSLMSPSESQPIEQPSEEFILPSRTQSFDENLKIKVMGSNDEIFLAKPVMVAEDDELLQKATKLSHLSNESRDVYLLPLNGDDADSPRMTSLSSELEVTTNTNNLSSLSNPPESLSFSEDSDTTRIYDIKTMETRFEKKPMRTTVSPETVKFFAPKTVPNFNKSNHIESKDKSPVKETSPPLPIDHTNADLINRLVIEDDVLPVLPSVKKLANVFASKQTTSETPQLASLQRPKSLDPLSSTNEMRSAEALTTAETKPASRIITIKKDNHPHLFKPGYSITGRSLSKQFKEELKQSTNAAAEENNNEVDCVNRNGTSSEGRITPERSPSPVLIPGRLKNNIAFYENLKRH